MTRGKITSKTRLKHHAQNLESIETSEPAQIMSAVGNNLHTCRFVDGTERLCELTTKLRNLIWIKRGSLPRV
jgi:translation initiation factor IF-1